MRGRLLVIGCGRGHDVVALTALGAEAHGLDISPTAIAEARRAHPDIPKERWHIADLLDLPEGLIGHFDAVVEHTCLSGLPPALRHGYAKGVTELLRPGGHIIGVWFINPEMDPGEEGPPFALPVLELDALFPSPWQIVDDYTAVNSFPGREDRERVRVLRKIS